MSCGHYWPFSVGSMVTPYTKVAKNATNDISIQEFHNVTRHYVKDTDSYATAWTWPQECFLVHIK